jgi:hypothetical protein
MALLNEQVNSRQVEEADVGASGCRILVRIIMERTEGQLEGVRVTHSKQGPDT